MKRLASLVAVSAAFAAWTARAQVSPTTPGDEQRAATRAEREQVIKQKLAEAAAKLKRIDTVRRLPQQESPIARPVPTERDRAEVAAELESWKRAMARFEAESICGPLDESVDVERYQGNLGPTRDFVKRHEVHVVQLQWYADLGARLGAGGDAGNVPDVRWCTGTLISPSVVLTAGHCFDQDGNGWRTPRKNGAALTPSELAPLMKLNFGYQLPPTGTVERQAVVFPIRRLLEHRLGDLDYALVEAGPDAQGKLPGERFGVARAVTSASTLNAAKMLTVIQHPLGRPKKIDAGVQLAFEPPYINYSDLDTQGGSSGSGVIDHLGNVVAVHVLGGCTLNGGANQGVTLDSIRLHSPYFQSNP